MRSYVISERGVKPSKKNNVVKGAWNMKKKELYLWLGPKHHVSLTFKPKLIPMIQTATKKVNRTVHFSTRLLRQPYFSSREKEVLKLIAYEYTTKEIASALYLSEHTIDTHKKNLKSKMDVRNTAGMIRRGFELGLLSL